MPANRENRFEPMGVADPNMILNVNVPETVQKQAREWRRGTRKRLSHSGRSIAYSYDSFPDRYDACFRSRGQRLWDQPREVKQHLAGKGHQESVTPYPRLQHLPGVSSFNDMAGDKGAEMISGTVKDDCNLQLPQPHHQRHPHHQTFDPRKGDTNEQLFLHHYQNQIPQRQDHILRCPFKGRRACLRLNSQQEPLISGFFEPGCEMSTEWDRTLAGTTVGPSKKTGKEESQKEEEMRPKYCRSFMIEDSNSKKTSKNTCTASKKKKNDFPSAIKSPASQPTCCVEPQSYFDKDEQIGANDQLTMSCAAKSATTDPHLSKQGCGGSGNFCLQYRCSSPSETPQFRGRSRCLRRVVSLKVSASLTGHEHIIQRNAFGESVLGHRKGLEANGTSGCTQDDLELTCSTSANSNTPGGTVDDITALSVAETVDFFLNMTSPLSGSDSEDSMDFPQSLGYWHLQREVFT